MYAEAPRAVNGASSGSRHASGDTKLQDPCGVLLVDKPTGITSHDVVDVVRRVYQIRAVGHTGTLDPAASGLMIMLIGKGTKIAPFVSSLAKCYQAGICLGQVSDTGDAEGRLTLSGDPSSVSREQVESTLRALHGEISLNIPAFAAVHTNGKRRYELARSGQTLPSLQRIASIYAADLLAFDGPAVTIRVRCSAGTYIRSLAEAIGEALGCGAYLASLRREEIGQWHVRDATNLRELEDAAGEKGRPATLRTIEEFLPFAQVHVRNESMPLIANGRPIVAEMVVRIAGSFAAGETVVVCAQSGPALAIAEARFASRAWPDDCPSGELFTYRRVLIS